MSDNLQAYGALPVPHMTPELISLIKTGEVFSLAVNYFKNMLAPGPMMSYHISPHLRHSDPTDHPFTAAAEVISMSIHVGTHIDALCHIAEKQDKDGNPDPKGESRIYAGKGKTVPASESVNHEGQKHNPIDKMPPIVTRTVMLDIAGYKGMDILPDAYVITADDIRGALAKQGSEIKAGTAVVIHTGFIHHLMNNNPACSDAQAGLGLEAAKFLVEQGMMLVGSDTFAVEAQPPNDHGVHRFHLVHNGITHIENLYLEELAAKQVYEFLMIITPLKLTGATGSWVHPIAIA